MAAPSTSPFRVALLAKDGISVPAQVNSIATVAGRRSDAAPIPNRAGHGYVRAINPSGERRLRHTAAIESTRCRPGRAYQGATCRANPRCYGRRCVSLSFGLLSLQITHCVHRGRPPSRTTSACGPGCPQNAQMMCIAYSFQRRAALCRLHSFAALEARLAVRLPDLLNG